MLSTPSRKVAPSPDFKFLCDYIPLVCLTWVSLCSILSMGLRTLDRSSSLSSSSILFLWYHTFTSPKSLFCSLSLFPTNLNPPQLLPTLYFDCNPSPRFSSLFLQLLVRAVLRCWFFCFSSVLCLIFAYVSLSHPPTCSHF
ncbi:hypothetical protein M408DRAFT_250885 [Serendipita vermifera MAFF 305830]|uniref:Uncharacterized protein n=1 Tax=Serendipita vermifera MAFF 305830 TaxID=933852 RepID=A0A0C3AGB4_SERVB|nr:hypothetical protein M408DRAFT_250885 [Serendipita vermifera MAFF 305830]